MALQHAILAALANQESSGYDLAKAFDVAVANFWAATSQQLYRELDKMEAAGLVAATVVQQEKRPAKRLFAMTDQGRAALHEFTKQAPRPAALRDELLVQVEVMELGDTESVRSSIEAKLEASEKKLERYLHSRELFLAGRTEEQYLERARRVGPYLTLTRGIAFEQENVRWCQYVLTALARRRK